MLDVKFTMLLQGSDTFIEELHPKIIYSHYFLLQTCMIFFLQKVHVHFHLMFSHAIILPLPFHTRKKSHTGLK